MPHPLIEHLARDHRENLRWMRARFRGRLADDEIEDALQAAYARALVSLSGRRGPVPQFESDEKARAWLRQIATRIAIDIDRERNGRHNGHDRRPRQVQFDTAETLPAANLVGATDIGAEVIEDLERHRLQPVILRALESLPDEHRQILKLRYSDALSPQAIMYLQQLTRRQYEGRHTRAIKAFTRALSKLDMSWECGQTRLLLKHDVQALLNPRARTEARAHIESCLSCQAFVRSTNSALAVMPLPFALAAWKLDALPYLTSSPAEHADAAHPSPAQAGASSPPAPGASAVVAHKLTVLAVTAAVGIGGVGAASSATTDPPLRPSAPAGSLQHQTRDQGSGTRWASSETQRMALERAARRAQRRREAARRQGGEASPRHKRANSRVIVTN